uniref:C2H2-type domain-containing protein n=2 Tax=Plectus sambesii TaxID=2011161 RepID=A0A914UWE1_9BILA
MGRKKKKVARPWCWYCNREFDDEKILIQHQKAKHFKCHICHKKLFTGPGLAIHCMQVHKETIDKIPAALPGRDSLDIEVYGMEGIPADAVQGKVEGEPSNKMARTDAPPPMPPMGFPPMGMMPMMPGFPMGMMPPGYPGMMPMMPPSMPPRMPPPPQGPSSVPLPPNSAPVASPYVAPPRLPSGAPPALPTPSIAPPPATFPAYSGAAPAGQDAAKGEPAGAPKSGIAVGASTKIVHPDEDISLEERRAQMTKYKQMLLPPPAGSHKNFLPPPQGMPAGLPPPMPRYGMPGRPY